MPAGEQGKRTDLLEAYDILAMGQSMYDVLQKQPSAVIRYSKGLRYAQSLLLSRRQRVPPSIVLLYGPTGCGKTRYAHDQHPPHELWSAPISGKTIWYDGYEQQPAALIDDFAGARSYYTLTNLLRLLDRYPLRVPYKGGYAPFLAETIYLTTNIHPIYWYDWTNRREQYLALVRRFTSVLWWKSGEQRVILDRADTSPDSVRSLEYFFNGPRDVAPLPENQLGVYVTNNDPYDF